MSDKLFSRVWAVTIGPAGEDGKSWDKLRVSFKVEKSGAAVPNALTLSVYNLSQASRDYVKKGMAVRLEGGYEGTKKLLFTGAVELANSVREGNDWVTTVKSEDGVRAYRDVVVAETFGPKTTVAAALRSVAEKMGVTVGEMKNLSKETFNQGRTISGPASRELDVLCRGAGLRWSIQDGVLQILPYGESLSQPAVLLSPETGLIGSPEKTEKGWKLRSLLQGDINPGRLVKVESQALKGFLIVENVEHVGDSHGGDWYTVIEALSVS